MHQTENFVHWASQIISNINSCALLLESYISLSNITFSELKVLCKTFPILRMNPEIFTSFMNIWQCKSLKFCVQKSLLGRIWSWCISYCACIMKKITSSWYITRSPISMLHAHSRGSSVKKLISWTKEMGSHCCYKDHLTNDG